MNFKPLQRLRAGLSFTEAPVAVLAAIVYVTILVLVFVTDNLAAVPSARKQCGMNVTKAYIDLHAIAARPHPYMVRTNDDVREYILSRVNEIAARRPHTIHVSDDRLSNASFSSSTVFGVTDEATYFEGTNILIKVDGTEGTDENSVLFSAHFDSVSTAPGATDDGMGVASLLALLEYLSAHPQRRTAVFNINNGEEDGLYGAHAFREHPWSDIVTTFLNLEGASSGGRPLLFRATSLAPLRTFHASKPHANVISADAFARGAIRSATDYSVYTHGTGNVTAGWGAENTWMEGLDFAFYRGRSRYHTRTDSIPHTVGSRRALWAMMDATQRTALALLDGNEKEADRGKPAVYFDFFGKALVVLPLSFVFMFNIMLLSVGTIAVLAGLLFVIKTAHQEREEAGETSRKLAGAKALIMVLVGWTRYWFMIILALLLHALLCLTFVKFNRYIVYSHALTVVVSAASLSYLVVVLPLNFATFKPSMASSASGARQQKLTTLLQTYLLTWLLLLGATIAEGRLQIGGLFFLTAWHAVVFLGVLLALFEAWFRARKRAGSTDLTARAGVGESTHSHGSPELLGGEDRFLVRGVRYEVGGTGTGVRTQEDGREVRAYAEDGENGEGAVIETEPTEITPLMYQHRTRSPTKDEEEKDRDEFVWWIPQILTVVPLPVVLVAQEMVIVVGALAQTVGDGSPPVLAYATITLFAFLLVLPLAPFAHRLHRIVTLVALLVFVITAAFAWTAVPFSEAEPLKVFFSQNLELPTAFNGASEVKAVTRLSGLPKYVDKRIVPELPSSWGTNVNCTADSLRSLSIIGCEWEGGLLPSPGPTSQPIPGASSLAGPSNWITYSIERTGSASMRVSVSGVNSRACRIYFDSHPVTHFHVHGSMKGMQPGYMAPKEGYKLLRLWSRTWHREFVVDAQWESDIAKGLFEGRVACQWSEYQSGSAGGSYFGGQIPALEEILSFLPKWALVTKKTDGLVEAWASFRI